MNQNVLKIIGAALAGLAASIGGWILGQTNSKEYHEREIVKEREIIRNLDKRISELEQTRKEDKLEIGNERKKIETRIKELRSQRDTHNNKITEHEEKLKTLGR